MRAEARRGQTGCNRRLTCRGTIHARDARFCLAIAGTPQRRGCISSMARVKRRSQARRGFFLPHINQHTRATPRPAATKRRDFSTISLQNFADLAARFSWQRSTCFSRHFERAPARPRCPYRRSRSSRDPPVPPHSARAPRRPEPARAPPRAPPGKMRRKAREGLTTRVWSAACST